MNRPLLRAIICGTTMVVLAAASIVLQTYVDVPLVVDYDRLFLTKPDRLLWFDTYRLNSNTPTISTYDLQTHKLQMCSLRQVQSEYNRTADGNYIRLPVRGTVQLLLNMDWQTRKTIRETVLPVTFDGELISQRFLVTQQQGMMYVCDVLAEDPSRLRTLPLNDWHPLAATEFVSVLGTELVVEISVTAAAVPPVSAAVVPPALPKKTFAINVYRIDERNIQLVASWTAGECQRPVFRDGDLLLSLSADGLRLEGREIENFAVVRNDALPPELVDGLPRSSSCQEICEFFDLASRTKKLYRLDTLQPLQHADGLAIEYRHLQIERFDSRFRILRGSDSAIQSSACRLAVYDLSRDALVFDRRFEGFPVAQLLSGDRLAVAYPYCGITFEIHDLHTGQRLEMVSPFAWLLPWLVLWSITSAVAAFGWIYYSARAGVSLLTSVLWLVVCFIPIQIYPLTQHGSTVLNGRLPVSYAIATLLISLPVGCVWIAFSGLGNRTLRSSCQLVMLSLIVMALVTLEIHNAFPQRWMLTGAVIIVAVSMVTSWIGLLVLGMRGYRAEWHGHSPPARSNLSLAHFFALSGTSALLVVSVVPFRSIPMAMHQDVPGVVAETLIVVFPYLFIFLLLMISDRWFARWMNLVILVATVLTLDAIVAFMHPQIFTASFILPYVRVFLMSLVFTSLWLWAFRLRGCRLSRGTVSWS